MLCNVYKRFLSNDLSGRRKSPSRLLTSRFVDSDVKRFERVKNQKVVKNMQYAISTIQLLGVTPRSLKIIVFDSLRNDERVGSALVVELDTKNILQILNIIIVRALQFRTRKSLRNV